MLDVFITIDTELSSGAYRSGWGAEFEENFARTIACRAPGGAAGSGGSEAGIFHQMDVMDAHGVRGIFFVDPMAALAWGQRAVDEIVQPILKRGHDVQLHCHTEWLELIPGNPLNVGTGQNIKDFSLEDQVTILGYAVERLMDAGAPKPAMFRAGNYGANDDTLRALAQLGVAVDTSFASALTQPCEISLPAGIRAPQTHLGIVELPIASIAARGAALRHAQITSLSAAEMIAALKHAQSHDWAAFVMVSHSFELFNRAKRKVNPIVRARFAAICEFLGANTALYTTPRAQDWVYSAAAPLAYKPLPHRAERTVRRMAEQAIGNFLYG